MIQGLENMNSFGGEILGFDFGSGANLPFSTVCWEFWIESGFWISDFGYLESELEDRLLKMLHRSVFHSILRNIKY